MKTLAVEIDRETGQILSAETPPDDLGARKRFIETLLYDKTIHELWMNSFVGGENEQERVREHGRGSGALPAVQGVYP